MTETTQPMVSEAIPTDPVRVDLYEHAGASWRCRGRVGNLQSRDHPPARTRSLGAGGSGATIGRKGAGLLVAAELAAACRVNLGGLEAAMGSLGAEGDLAPFTKLPLDEVARVLADSEQPLTRLVYQLTGSFRIPGDVKRLTVDLQGAREQATPHWHEVKRLELVIASITDTPDYRRWQRVAVADEAPNSRITSFAAELANVCTDWLAILRSETGGAMATDGRRHLLSRLRAEFSKRGRAVDGHFPRRRRRLRMREVRYATDLRR